MALFISIFASLTSCSAFCLSFKPDALIFTLSPAPRTAARAASTPTPASETLLGLPSSAIARQSSNTLYEACIVCNGTSVANKVASCIAIERAVFSSADSLGSPKADMIRLNASVSSSTSTISSDWIA